MEKLALWILCILGVVLIIGITVATVVMLIHKRGEDITNFLTVLCQSTAPLQLVTVALIIITVILLGALDKLNEGVTGLLGALGGYVLGSISKKDDNGTPIP